LLGAPAPVTGVDPQVQEARKATACGLQKQLDAVLVRELCAGYFGF
jgi:hypothetical protein